MKVTTRLLNGRSEPRKSASREALFDFGDVLEPTGRWSKDYKWIEVYGGETGTVWVDIRYVNARTEPFIMMNENNGTIKIRKKPFKGRITGYIRNGETVVIDKVILNWGHCKKGWVDLDYLIEEV